MSHERFESLFREAVRFHQTGKLAEAEASYRSALSLRADDSNLLQMLGVVVAQRGRVDEGVTLIRRAIEISPGVAGYWGNLGYAFASARRLSDAAEAFRHAVDLTPGDPAARMNLASSLREAGRFDEAIDQYKRAINLAPPTAEALNLLGVTLRMSGRANEAVDCFKRALSLRGNLPELLYNLCDALLATGATAEAEAAARRAVALNTGDPAAWFGLGNCLRQQGRMNDAVEALQRCVALRPDFAEARHNLGGALREARRLDESLDQFRTAQSLGLDGFAIRNNIGLVLKDMGDLKGALDWFEKALEANQDPVTESNLIYTSQFLPETSPEQIRTQLARWNERYARPLANKIAGFSNDCRSDRPLRVGYVAPNLGNHPVGRFFLPLVKEHDRTSFELYVYCDVAREDIGEQIRANTDTWRSTAGMSDEQVARQIREDRIDILVDLMMHVGNHRLLVFARKPAPVQVTYLAYPGSTGLETIDYRLTDPYLDPPSAGADQPQSSEEPIRLPHCFWCYTPPAEAPAVGSLPALRTGSVTFGSLNSAMKINDSVATAWSRILREVPGSRLIVHTYDGPERTSVSRRLEQAGVELARVEFARRISLREYFGKYNDLDIALDPFPYPGGTTTCDALWMGVPVVTLGGNTPLSRGGVSILSNIGLQELITSNVEDYVSTAVARARDLARLENLRAGLRDRMRASPLMDAKSFVREVEDAFRVMWNRWCAQRPPTDSQGHRM